MLQKGEPLLSEIVLAWLWCSFLDKEDFWYWQKNHDKNISFNQEYSWIARIALNKEEIKKLFEDTYSGTKAIFDNPTIYDDLCLIAWLFDLRKIRYKEYLEIITNYFENRNKKA